MRAALLWLGCAGVAAGQGHNVCSLESSSCECEEETAERRERCEGIKPIFEHAGFDCVNYNTDSVSCQAEGNHGFCEWKGVMVENVVQGKCVTSICWLKFQHTLAACPEFWPNVTTVGPDTWAAASGSECSSNCALHFASFYEDTVCMEWLDDLVLCDRWRLRPLLHEGCAPKPAMRDDMEAFAQDCLAQAENQDIANVFIFILVIGALAALCGHFISKQIRKSEKLEMEDIMLEQKAMDRNNTHSLTGDKVLADIE